MLYAAEESYGGVISVLANLPWLATPETIRRSAFLNAHLGRLKFAVHREQRWPVFLYSYVSSSGTPSWHGLAGLKDSDFSGAKMSGRFLHANAFQSVRIPELAS